MRASEARAVHDDAIVVDLHADTLKLMDVLGYELAARHRPALPRRVRYAGHLDLPRLRDGGVAAQFFGMWTVPYPERGCAASIHRQLDALDRATAASPGEIARAEIAEDVRAARRRGQLAALAGIEGGQALEGDLGNVAAFAARGVRYLGLLHFTKNAIGHPARGVGERDRGLTGFGRDVVREMNRLGMIVDLTHINRRGFMDAAGLSTDPVMVTHTGVAGVREHWRNIDDLQLRAVADKGGCVGVIFAPRFLGGGGVDAVCDHILHIVDVAGEDTPSLGSDFDGFVIPPDQLGDASELPNLTAALARRGLAPRVLTKILGENALRVLADVPPR